MKQNHTSKIYAFLRKIQIALLSIVASLSASAYTVTEQYQNFGTISIPATFTGTLSSSGIGLIGIGSLSFNFKVSNVGTYNMKLSATKNYGATKNWHAKISSGGSVISSIESGGSCNVTFSSGTSYTITLFASAVSYSVDNVYNYSFAVNLSSLQKKTYTVLISSGSYASGTSQSLTKTEGEVLSLPGALFTRSGYTQKGWSKNANGTSKDYVLYGSYSDNASITLYPYWEKDQTTYTDLLFYQPSGWGDKLVVATTTGTSSDASTFCTDDTIYLDFAAKNSGTAQTGAVYVDIYVDGTRVDYWPYSAGLAAGGTYQWKDKSIGTLSAGSHVILIQLRQDSKETATGNNTYQKTIVVNESGYTITFNAGTSGSWYLDAVRQRTLKRDVVYSLDRPSGLTCSSGKRLVGWQCSNGKRYDPGVMIFNLAQPGKTVTMTAIWE